MKTAAIILIGNEILSGKVEDANGVYAIRRFRGLGVSVRRLIVVPDTSEAIADEVRSCSARYDVVVTSGGVGPTHDDITLDCVAAAFDVQTYRHPVLEERIRSHFGDRLTPDHLRMATVPVNTELIEGTQIAWPVIQVRNVYVFPGIPGLFRLKFEAISARFQDGVFHLRTVDLKADEGSIASLLRTLEERYGVSVGSYPRFGDPHFKVRVTIEARTAEPVNEATEFLISMLEPFQVYHVSEAVGK